MLASLLGTLFGVSADRLSANGAPQRVVLAYLEGLSNWGPKKAAGVMEVVNQEGQVSLKLTNLEMVTGGSYEAWLKNTRTGDTFSCGRFNTNSQGNAEYRKVLPDAVPDISYNLGFISVEDTEDLAKTSSRPSSRVSIAGFFPQPSASGGALPAELPATGEPAAASSDPLGNALLGAAIALLLVNLVNTGLIFWRRSP